MDGMGNPTSELNTPLLMLVFLHQTDCGNAEYRKELHSLSKEMHVSLDINSNGFCIETQEDGELESDGHLPSYIRGSFDDIHPTVELEGPVNGEEAAAIQEVAAELREIAAQFELSVVARATENLSRKLLVSPLHLWKDHLRQEVERLLSQGVILEQLPQERVIVALTLTLVKGVCEQAPRLLRSIFYTALRYISSVMTM